jgi:uncharacterized protein (TIGR03083 family)
MDLGTAYLEVQERLIGAATDPAVHDTPVPACPAWTVRDVVGHVAGIAEDAVGGSVPGLDLLEQWRDESVATARDQLTDRQVTRSRAIPFDAVVSGWRQSAESLVPILRGEAAFPGEALMGFDSILVSDLWVHDADVGGALGLARPADGLATSVALAAFAFGVAYRVQALGLPAFALRYGDKNRPVGTGEPAATVTAERYELVRMLAGRRSRAQIKAMKWEGDPTPYLSIIPAYGERETDLVD